MHLALVTLFSGLLCLSGAAAAGDECIPRYPAREKSGAATTAFAKAEPVRIASEAPSPRNAIGAIASAQVAAGEYHSPAGYGTAAKGVAIIGVGLSANTLVNEIAKGQSAAPGAVGKATADLVASVGATSPVAGVASATSIYADLKKASIDLNVGNETRYENYTAAVGKTAAAIAGGAVGGPKGADLAVGGFDAAVKVGDSVAVFAQDTYFANQDAEIARRADADLMARYEALLKKRGVDLSIPVLNYRAPLPGR